MHAPKDVVEQALSLSDEARAELALRLLDSLTEPADATDEDWIAEIEARADRFLSGASSGVAWDELHADVKARLRKP